MSWAKALSKKNDYCKQKLGNSVLWAAAETGTTSVYKKIHEEEAIKDDIQTVFSDMRGPWGWEAMQG